MNTELDPQCDLSTGSIYEGFRFNQIVQLPNLRAVALRFEHVKSGARLLHLHTNDTENCFAITFPTPPPDDTGLPHILEHSVLGGSRKFPVREPFFERYDLLLTPTTACAAFDLKEGGTLGPDTVDGKEASPASWVSYTFPFNFTGQPAASVPCGFTAGGLPVGLQVVGRRYDESLVLRAAAAFEAAYPWSGRRPEL